MFTLGLTLLRTHCASASAWPSTAARRARMRGARGRPKRTQSRLKSDACSRRSGSDPDACTAQAPALGALRPRLIGRTRPSTRAPATRRAPTPARSAHAHARAPRTRTRVRVLAACMREGSSDGTWV
eukprot:6201017-Pleurochrysis_carterae.AAC.2